MQDADLCLSLAGIAGVFVGFAALISAKGVAPSEPQEITYKRVLVAMGMLAVVAALAPVTLDRYGLTYHEVWAASSVLGLIGFLGVLALNARMPEHRASWQSTRDARLRPGDTLLELVHMQQRPATG